MQVNAEGNENAILDLATATQRVVDKMVEDDAVEAEEKEERAAAAAAAAAAEVEDADLTLSAAPQNMRNLLRRVRASGALLLGYSPAQARTPARCAPALAARVFLQLVMLYPLLVVVGWQRLPWSDPRATPQENSYDSTCFAAVSHRLAAPALIQSSHGTPLISGGWAPLSEAGPFCPLRQFHLPTLNED